MTPLVHDLDKDGVPEVVFVSFTNSDYVGPGVLRIVSGRDGSTLHSIAGSELMPVGSAQPAIVDLDGDGFYEVVYIHRDGTKVIALNSDGSLRWKFSPTKTLSNVAEVSSYYDFVRKTRVVVADTLLVAEKNRQPYSLGSVEGASTVLSAYAYPLDASRPTELSLVNSNGVFDSATMKAKFTFPTAANNAVAELDPTSPGLEIVGTGGGRLWIVGSAGQVLVNKDLAAYNSLTCANDSIGGGPPSVGNFDEDPSTTEIAMATGRYLTIFDARGNLVGQIQTQDCSSLATGISSFDFNGDGKSEIVYSDEEYLRIYELHEGKLREVFRTPNPNGTLAEYPVIVDVDGNGSSELLVVSNNYPVPGFYKDAGEADDGRVAAGITGVRAFTSSTANAWVSTRPSWPQYSFNPVMDSLVPGQANLSTLLQGYLGKTFRRNSQLAQSESGCK